LQKYKFTSGFVNNAQFKKLSITKQLEIISYKYLPESQCNRSF
jgi:hypothetical protein